MFSFSVDPAEYPYREGSLYIGESDKGVSLGVLTKRHAITVAGSRTGKGVGVIIPNLKLWPNNVLVIDPKGEAAAATWQDRKNMGQAVHVLDPFRRANIPDSVRASYNPLDDLDPTSPTIKEDIAAIADGTVLRPNPEAEHWDNGALRLISGLIAYVLTRPTEAKNNPSEPSRRNLLEVRRILVDRRQDGLFNKAIDTMMQADGRGCQAVMKAGAAAAYAKEGAYYISNAEKQTDWLDSDVMYDVMAESTFSMRDIKQGKASVFVCLPFKYLSQQQHGRFLRMMVRCGIDAMQSPMPDGSDVGEKCLFILDEFFSLGYIDEVATSIGGMAGYGLHLWPFLQDLDQLWKLYGSDGAGTFFGSSDLHQFFANTDKPTLDYISDRVGSFNVDDLPNAPKYDPEGKVQSILDDIDADKKSFLGGNPAGRQGMAMAGKIEVKYQQDVYQERLSRFNNDASRVLGKPRLAPDQIAHLVRLEEEAAVAEAQVAFVHGVRPLICKLSPYFEWKSLPQPKKPKPKAGENKGKFIGAERDLKALNHFVASCDWCNMLEGRHKDGLRVDESHHLGVVAKEPCSECGGVCSAFFYMPQQDEYKLWPNMTPQERQGLGGTITGKKPSRWKFW